MLDMQVSEFHTLTFQKALRAALVPTAGRLPRLLLLQHSREALLSHFAIKSQFKSHAESIPGSLWPLRVETQSIFA